MQTKEQHDATTYTRIWLRAFLRKGTFFPENLVAATPIKIFGYCIGFKMTLARADYPWQCSCTYKKEPQECRAKVHDVEGVCEHKIRTWNCPQCNPKRSAPSYGDLADLDAFFTEHAPKGIDEAVRLAALAFPTIDLEDIRSSAESAIPEFPEKEYTFTAHFSDIDAPEDRHADEIASMLEAIAKQLRDGFTSGHSPTWTLETK